MAETRKRDNDQFPNGELRLYGLVGDPIAQVRAPYPVTRLLREAGANAALVPLHVRPENLASTFAALRSTENLDGLVVTVPHKVAMAGLVDDLSERARLVGAINLARRGANGRWHGDICDGVGFVRGLDRNGFDPGGREVFLVGAGGAGSAIAAELARRGASLHIYDIATRRAADLVERLKIAGYERVVVAELPDPTGAALVVNATPLGMNADDPLPVAPSLLASTMMVADVVMKPSVTAFLEEARRAGCRIQLGEAVMVNQLDAMIEFFLSDRLCNGKGDANRSLFDR